MENSISMGIYTRKDTAAAHMQLPPADKSGLWQVWKMPDKKFMIQPLGADKEPSGEKVLITAPLFYMALQPVPAMPTFCTMQEEAPELHSASPELLSFWLDQARLGLDGKKDGALDLSLFRAIHKQTGASAGLSPGGEDPTPCVESPFAENPSLADRASFSPGAPGPVLSGANLPLTTVPREAALPPAYPPPPEKSWPSTPIREADDKLFLPPIDVFVTKDSLQAMDEGAPYESADVRIRKLERDMRGEFTKLIRLLDADAHPAAEDAIARLLRRGTEFTAEQKFMFTEFGLALRRKQKARLSLQSHLRALELAPYDEHVLFNVARMEYELGDLDSAKQHLQACLVSAPDFAAARDFLHFLNSGAL